MYLIVPLLARLDFLGVCGKMWEEVVGSGIFTKRCTGKVFICVILAILTLTRSHKVKIFMRNFLQISI